MRAASRGRLHRFTRLPKEFMSTRYTVFRQVIGALAGGFVGAVMGLSLPALGGDELSGFALLIVGLPLGVAVGVRIGAKSAGTGPSARAHRRAAVLAVLIYVLLLIVPQIRI
jgi:hypothetical protein